MPGPATVATPHTASPTPASQKLASGRKTPTPQPNVRQTRALASKTRQCPHSYYRARYYQPAIGRFVAEDSWGTEDGPSLYAYVANRPVIYHDPSGHKVFNNSCQRIYVKSEAGDNVLVIIPQGGSADADGFYNVTPDSCSGFCGRGPGGGGSPFPEVRKINNWTDVVITGGCNGGCLEWSYSGAGSGAADIADPRTGWKDGSFFAKHPDWPKPPTPPTPCCAFMNWTSSGS